MKTNYLKSAIILMIAIVSLKPAGRAAVTQPVIKEETSTYKIGDSTFRLFIAYDQNIKGKRPVVLAVHEWWGMNDYLKMRARRLAALGYFAVAVDLFGNGKVAANPKEAQELTGPFYHEPTLAKQRLEAAIEKIRDYPMADMDNVAAVGYCFGGGMLLDAAKLGLDLKGVVAFHPALPGLMPDKKLLKAIVLVCYGDNDKFVSMKAADKFKQQMDSIHAEYQLKVYPGATHAFTNPDATKIGKEFHMPIQYNPQADKDSWNDMKAFLARLFKS